MADQLEKNQQVINNLYQLQFLINTIQLESNNYVLTGDSTFLPSYTIAKNEIPHRIKEVKLINILPVGHSRLLDTIITNTIQLVGSAEKHVKLKQQDKYHPGLFKDKIEEGWRCRRVILRLTDQIISEASKTSQSIRLKNVKSYTVLDNILTSLVVVIFSLLSIIFLSVRYNFKKQKASETRLRESEQQFESFFNLSPVPTSITEASTGKILFINDAYEKLFAIARAEAYGKTLSGLDIITTRERKNISDRIQRNGGRLINVEMKLATKNGELKDINASFDTITTNGVKYYLGCMIDITDKKAAEKRLIQSEERFNTITKMNPVPTFISEIDTGKFMYVNDAFMSFLGLKYEEIVGKTSIDLDLFDWEYRNKIAEMVLNNKGKAEGLEVKINTKNEVKDVLLSADTVYIDNRRCFIGTTYDISERKKSEEALMTAYIKEKELSIIKSNFVTIASHEFRTPLTTILSSASLLEMYTTTEQQTDRIRHTKRIKSSSTNLIAILDELLSLDELETASVAPKLRKFDLEEFIHILCIELKYAAKKGQVIEYTHEGEKIVNSDSTFIRHIVNNLVSNALKYSPEEVVVQVHTAYDGNKLVLNVKDSGIGISASDQKNLFRRFFRASNAGTVPGTGLGLHIAKRYVDLLGGEIKIHSTLGQGTLVTVDI